MMTRAERKVVNKAVWRKVFAEYGDGPSAQAIWQEAAAYVISELDDPGPVGPNAKRVGDEVLAEMR